MRFGWIFAGVAVVVAALTAAAVLTELGGEEPAETGLALVVNGPAERGSRLLEDAARLLDRGAGPEAERAYAEALAIFREADLLAAAAEAAFGMGRASHLEGQSEDARRWYAEALALYGNVGRTAGEARVLAAMGDLARNTFHPEEAARHYRRARDTWRSVPRPESDPHPLLGLEAVPAMPDGEVRARAVVDEAAQVYGAIGDAAGSGDVQMVLGELELAVGNASAAAAAFRGAREQYGGADLPVLAATAALWQARTEMDRGLNIAADATLEVAEALFAAVGEDQGVGRVLFAQGSLARQLGHMESAASFYREAAAQLASDASAANALVRLGEVEAWRGDTEAAWEAFQGAGRLAARSGAVRLGLGLMALGEGDPGTAQEHLAAAVDRFAASGDAVQHGRALLGLAEVAALLDPGSAPALYEWAGTLFAAGVSPFGELLAATREAAFAYDSGDATRSVELTKRARQLRRKMRRPVAEANRFLGLPAVEQIEVGEEDLGHHFGPDILAQEALAATRAANLAQHPNHNREARDLVVATDAALLALGFEV